MAKEKKKRGRLTKKLIHKYKFVVLNTDTFEERFTFRLSRLNVFILVSLLALFLFFITLLVIAFTPLKEYIPGYSSSKLRREAVELTYKTDSLEQVIAQNNAYFKSIQNLLRGDSISEASSSPENIDKHQVVHREIVEDSANIEAKLSPSKVDSILRKEVERNESYNIFNPFTQHTSVKLYPPIKGRISQHFNSEKRHYGIDVSVEENSPVKAVADGIVLFSEWTVETGYVIILKHDFNLISVYKHNITLLKKQGDYVKQGEVIALTGNTGEFTTGPHLHFELWEEGHAVDPEVFFDFDR